MLHLIIGDCRKVLKGCPSNLIHLVVTSPPYNVGIRYDGWNDNMDINEYLKFTEEWLRECYRVLVDGGRICINLPIFNFKGKINLFYEYSRLLRKVGFKERDVIIWVKRDKHRFRVSQRGYYGSVADPHNPILIHPCEVVLIYHKNKKWLDCGGETDISFNEYKKWVYNVWEIPPELDRKHPCPYPEELPRRLIKLYSYVGNIVLDPFAGYGTTLKVAGELRRHCIGIEISRKYVSLMKRRIPPLVVHDPKLYTWDG